MSGVIPADQFLIFAAASMRFMTGIEDMEQDVGGD